MEHRFRLLLLVALAGLGAGQLARAAEGTGEKKKKLAGISIESKGCRGLVVQLEPGRPVEVLSTQVVNTTLMDLDAKGRFKPEAIEDTLEAIDALMGTITSKFGLEAGEVPIVGSSGLMGAKNRDALAAAVKKKTGKAVTFLDPATEVKLSLDGLLVREKRAAALLLDVGSGNTKGGAFVYDEDEEAKKLRTFSVPFGTVTLTSKALLRMRKDRGGFAEAVGRVAEKEVAPALVRALKGLDELRRREPVVLTGGAAWAMCSVVHPGKMDEPLLSLKAGDIDRYLEILDESEAFPVVDLSSLTDAGQRKRARGELDKVRSAFTPENLRAGAELLRACARALRWKGDKPLVFARNGHVAWLLGLLGPKPARRGAADGRTSAEEDRDDGKKEEKPEPIPPPRGALPARVCVVYRPCAVLVHGCHGPRVVIVHRPVMVVLPPPVACGPVVIIRYCR